jgi:hypothetical protein
MLRQPPSPPPQNGTVGAAILGGLAAVGSAALIGWAASRPKPQPQRPFGRPRVMKPCKPCGR